MHKMGFVIVSSLFLAGCGGGGGASAVSEWLGTDPNAVITTKTGVTYDLTHGTPDANGTTDALNYNNGLSSYTYPTSVNVFGGTVSSAVCATQISGISGCGPTIGTPHPDVIAAWNKGWTGAGVNVLIVDNVKGYDSKNPSKLDPHPAIVTAIAARYAVGANFYGANYNDPNANIFDFSGNIANPNTSIKIGVINASFGSNLPKYLNRENLPNNPWTTGELQTARQDFATYWAPTVSLARDGIPNSAFGITDAVIAKSAGNDHIDAQYEPLNYYLSRDSSILSRLLVVGALDDTGSTTRRATLADYSNTAGIDETIQNRFLVASGLLPFNGNDVAYDGAIIGNGVGTSFAAPRVAGYAAILRQKFPNLTAANTADLLLQTARYDTLTCYPNCDKTIYGQGEVSLGHAMSPVGALR